MKRLSDMYDQHDGSITINMTKRVMAVGHVLPYAKAITTVTKEYYPGEKVITFCCTRSAEDKAEIMTRVKIIRRETDTTTYVIVGGKMYLDNTTNDVIARYVSNNRIAITKLSCEPITNILAALISCLSRKIHSMRTIESLMYMRIEII